MTALVNLAVTFFLPPTAFPVRPHEAGDLTYLVHNEQLSVDRRFGLYMELGDATDGGVLVVPSGTSIVDPELAEGFAELEVVECAFDPTVLPAGVTEAPTIGTFESDDGDFFSYSIVTGHSELWWLVETDAGIIFVPASVAAPPDACL